MKWTETTASDCRYGDVAEEIWGDWDILWEKSENNYQGSVAFVARKGGRYCCFEYDYGSCTGCDYWEDKGSTYSEIEQDMRDSAEWFDDLGVFLKFCDMKMEPGYGEDRKTIGYYVRTAL